MADSIERDDPLVYQVGINLLSRRALQGPERDFAEEAYREFFKLHNPALIQKGLHANHLTGSAVIQGGVLPTGAGTPTGFSGTLTADDLTSDLDAQLANIGNHTIGGFPTLPAADNYPLISLGTAGGMEAVTPQTFMDTILGLDATAPIAFDPSTGNISHNTTAVTPGSYTYASITVDSRGHLTAASSGTAAVTAVTGSGILESSGGLTPDISMVSGTGPFWVGRTSGTGEPTYQTAAALPAAVGGTAQTTWARGDLMYASAANTLSKLTVGAANRSLLSDGTDVAWGQVSLTAGVTGDLPFANLAQIAGVSVLGVTGSSTADVAAITSGAAYRVLRADSTNATIGFGAIDISQSAAVTGVLGYANGGTAQSSWARGDTLYASAANTLSKLTVGAANRYLKSDGTDVSWGQISLTAGVTGVLPEANGGTNQSTYTRGDLLYASAANTLSKLAVGAANRYLSSDGTDPSWGQVSLTAGVSGDLPFSSFVQAGSAGYVGATGAGDYAHRTIANVKSDLGLGTMAYETATDYLSKAGNLSGLANTSTSRTNLGVAIGTDVQAYDAQLTSVAALSYAGNALKVIRVNAGETDFELATAGVGTITGTPGGTDNRLIRADGTGTAIQGSAATMDDSGNLSGLGTVGSGAITATGASTIRFAAAGLGIEDTNASHQLILTPGSDLTANRVLTLTTGDAARTLTINANATIGANTTAIEGLTSAANKLPYFTGSGTADVADFTASARTLTALNITRGGLYYGSAANVVSALAVGAAGTYLKSDGTDVSWVAPPGGGDMTGPGAAVTDNAAIRWNGTGGTAAQNSLLIIGDTGAVSGLTSLAMGGALSGATTGAFSGTVTLSSTGSALESAGSIGLASGKKLILDGVYDTPDTYVFESSANVIDLVTGGVAGLRVSSTTTTVYDDLHVQDDADIDGDLNVDGAAVIDGALDVGGAITGLLKEINIAVGNSPYTLTNAQSGASVNVNTAGGAVTLKFPATPSAGFHVYIWLYSYASDLTLDGNGADILLANSTVNRMGSAGASAHIIYCSAAGDFSVNSHEGTVDFA